MAKVKKMFGGGMGSRMAAPRAPMGSMGARMGGAGGMPTQSRMQAGARTGAGASPSGPNPAQLAAIAAMQQQGTPSAAADAGAAKAFADMQAQRGGSSGAMPIGSQASNTTMNGPARGISGSDLKQAGMMRKGGVTKMAKGGVTKSGGGMKESKKMVGKELAFMKKKGAPKSMIKHEMKEAGVKKMAKGGLAAGHKSADGIASKGKTKAKQVKMAYGGKC